MSYVLSQPHPFRLRRFFSYNFNDTPTVIYSPRVYRPYNWSYPVISDWLSPATYIRQFGDNTVDDVRSDELTVDGVDVDQMATFGSGTTAVNVSGMNGMNGVEIMNRDDPEMAEGLRLLRDAPHQISVVGDDGQVTNAATLLGRSTAGSGGQMSGGQAAAQGLSPAQQTALILAAQQQKKNNANVQMMIVVGVVAASVIALVAVLVSGGKKREREY
jgi:hypothetical protein